MKHNNVQDTYLLYSFSAKHGQVKKVLASKGSEISLTDRGNRDTPWKTLWGTGATEVVVAGGLEVAEEVLGEAVEGVQGEGAEEGVVLMVIRKHAVR